MRPSPPSPIRTELQQAGYTKDAVVVECANPSCDHKVTCKWTRNQEPGRNFQRPIIQIPDDWRVVFTYGSDKQDVLCPTCDPAELPEGILLR